MQLKHFYSGNRRPHSFRVTPNPPLLAADDSAPTGWCEVRGWKVFANGAHRGELYSPASVATIVLNFARLRGYLTPIAALGHDRQARLTESMGMPNVGEVVGVRTTDGRDLILDITGVPAWLGGMINAKRYRAGSVELKPFLPNPADASKRIDGPIIEAVVFLGDESPAVKGCPPPEAVYPDGTPVPKYWGPLTIPAELLATLSRDSKTGGREPALCFSEAFAMTPEQMTEALRGMLPDAVLAALDATALKAAYDSMVGEGAAEFSAAMKKKFSDAMPVTPVPATSQNADIAAQMAEMSKCMSDLTKRVGDVEAAKVDEQKKGDEAKVAAFSDRVNRALDANRKRFAPGLRPALFKSGVDALALKTYGEVSNDADKAFATWQASIEVMPESKMFSDSIVDKKPAGAIDGKALNMVQHLAILNPRVVERLTKSV